LPRWAASRSAGSSSSSGDWAWQEKAITATAPARVRNFARFIGVLDERMGQKL
jgi:hypothetical protein